MDTTIRYLEMLQFLPRYPRKKSLSEIRDHLNSCGYKVSDRTIQRDLKKLETPFGLICDDRSIPFGWSFSQVARRGDIAEIDENEALLLMLVRDHLNEIIPLEQLPRMNLMFNRATKVLNAYNHEKIHGWKNKIKIKPAFMNYMRPKVESEISSSIIECLLNDKQFEGEYRSLNGLSKHIYNPLGLVSHGVSQRLICYREINIDKILHLPLHRFQSCQPLKDDICLPDNFDLEQYLEAGQIEYLYKKDIQLKLQFTHEAGQHLFETPIDPSQEIEITNDGKNLLVKATIHDTETLRRWILGFGVKVKVIEPKYLVKEIAMGNP